MKLSVILICLLLCRTIFANGVDCADKDNYKNANVYMSIYSFGDKLTRLNIIIDDGNFSYKKLIKKVYKKKSIKAKYKTSTGKEFYDLKSVKYEPKKGPLEMVKVNFVNETFTYKIADEKKIIVKLKKCEWD